MTPTLTLTKAERSTVYRSLTVYDSFVIRSFRHKGLETFFRTGSKSGIKAQHAKRLNLQLTLLNVADHPEEMNLPGWDWHRLKGERKGHSAVSVNGNWRLTFLFEATDAVLVNYADDH